MVTIPIGRLVLAIGAAGWMAAMPYGGARAALFTTEIWQGSYHCAQGPTGLTLTTEIAASGQVRALFEFYDVTQNPSVPRGCFEMSGTIDPSLHLALVPGKWRLRPSNYVPVALDGILTGSDGLNGTIIGPGCTTFSLHRVTTGGAESGLTACIGVVS